jgi:hypothetical protein
VKYWRRVASYALTQVQKNAVFQRIRAAGLNPDEFAWLEEPSNLTMVGGGRPPYTVEILGHAPTGFWFRFDTEAHRNSMPLWVVFRPASDGGPEERAYAGGGWDHVLDFLNTWLDLVREEHAAPDLWAALRNSLRDEFTEVDDTKFTQEEQELIGTQLRKFLEYTRRTYELPAAQDEVLDAEINDLIGAASQLNKREWRKLLLGTLLGWLLQGAVPPELFQQLLHVALHALAPLFGGPPIPELSPGMPA